ncbi:MAG: hypothetical protein LCH26_06475 [Proteobacteria bacterium]|nr:hypothetical protein [Pseudomonadota bacterium]
MDKRWALGLILLAIVAMGLALAMHKGLLNAELPVQFNPTPAGPDSGTCPADELRAQKHTTNVT